MASLNDRWVKVVNCQERPGAVGVVGIAINCDELPPTTLVRGRDQLHTEGKMSTYWLFPRNSADGPKVEGLEFREDELVELT